MVRGLARKRACGSPPARPRSGLRAAAARGRRDRPGDADRRRRRTLECRRSECETADGFVLNGARTFELRRAGRGGRRRSPPSSPPLRARPRARLAGQSLPRLDSPGQERRQLALRRRRALAGHAVRLGAPRPARRAADRLLARGDASDSRASATSPRATDGSRWSPTTGGLPSSPPGRRPAILRRRVPLATFARCSRTRSNPGARAMVQPRRLRLDGRKARAPCRHLLGRAVAASRPRAGHRDRARSAAISSSSGPRPRRPISRARARGRMRRYIRCRSATGRPRNGGRRNPDGGGAGRELKRPVQVSLSQSASQNHDRVAPGRWRE